jgi:GGDEF domain-containing protein
MLQRVVALIRAHVRSYDLIVRLGGDEFLCAMSNMSLWDARERLSEVGDALGRSCKTGAIRTGFAQLMADESATELIARADKELLARRN